MRPVDANEQTAPAAAEGPGERRGWGMRLAPWLPFGLAVLLLWFLTDQLAEVRLNARLERVIASYDCPLQAHALRAVARRFDLDPLLLLAVALQESSCRPDAVGPRGSRGLLQLQTPTAREVARRHGIEWRGEAGLFDPDTSLLIGAAHLSDLYRELGGWDSALAAYNLGRGRYRRLQRVRGAVDSAYAEQVLARWAEAESRAVADAPRGHADR